ncbi:MAG: hypothetical protein Q8L14_19440 [Myxococcales bacterium]|nr:hypothetical protein [Myxococcales bacterium]
MASLPRSVLCPVVTTSPPGPASDAGAQSDTIGLLAEVALASSLSVVAAALAASAGVFPSAIAVSYERLG